MTDIRPKHFSLRVGDPPYSRPNLRGRFSRTTTIIGGSFDCTVCATVFALFPLAAHGGPLWQPMCYAQIGGLTVATVVTLVLVPVIYSIFVLDLRLVKWETESHAEGKIEAGDATPSLT